MQTDDILDAPAVPVNQPLVYSKIWQRLLAGFIDLVIIGGFGFFVSMSWEIIHMAYTDTIVVKLAIGFLYYVILVKKSGATVGKIALRLKIVRTDGAPISWGNAVMRYVPIFLAGLFVYLPTVLYQIYSEGMYSDEWLENPMLDYMIMGYAPVAILYGWHLANIIAVVINKQRRSLNDRIARTVVVRKEKF